MKENSTSPKLIPKPETDQFREEMLHPQFIEEGGVEYAVFQLNQDRGGGDSVPVVINLAHGEEASIGAGRFDLNAFAQIICRPLIVIDMAGMGKSKWQKPSDLRRATFESMAENHLKILDKLGASDFDIVGNSMGAVMAAKIAVLAGERTRHLVTFSSPGFEARPARIMALSNSRQNKVDFKRARESLPPEIKEEAKAASEHRKMNQSDKKVQMIRSVLRYGRLLTRPSLEDIGSRLSIGTKWTDVIGTEDAFSDWSLHVNAVNARNENIPDSSDVLVLDNESHAWQAYYRWEVASIAERAMEK